MRLQQRSATAAQSKVLVTLPNGGFRQMEAGLSSIITKAVVEVFAHRFLSDPALLWISEFVRKHHVGLQSFRSMRRMEARRRKVSALRLRHSQSLASLRQRPNQARLRSTIQRLGRTAKPLA